MKKVDIIIPTRNRYEKLTKCLESIPEAAQNKDLAIETVIICDGDPKTALKLIEDRMVDRVIFVKSHKGSVYCRNLATQSVADALICTVDDMVFLPGAIDEAAKAMDLHFPDGDGVIGFTRADRDYTKMKKTSGCYFGIGLTGHKFLLRYPEKALYYPHYFLFAAQEVTNLAVLLNKIKMEPKAKIFHYAPGKGGDMDQTHIDGRKWKHQDRALRRERSEKGLLWGLPK